MDDREKVRPDHTCLFHAATEQHGYFTAAQARSCGFSWALLSYHARTGRFIRDRHGLYRLRDYPSFWREDVVAAWLAVGKERAVVSHQSALDLLDLSDVIPNAVHLTVPRSVRHLPQLPGVKIHTTSRPFHQHDLTWREGIRVTSATRTILDATEVGVGPEQIEMAIHQAISRGLATPAQLEQGARQRDKYVRFWVFQALELAAA